MAQGLDGREYTAAMLFSIREKRSVLSGGRGWSNWYLWFCRVALCLVGVADRSREWCVCGLGGCTPV